MEIARAAAGLFVRHGLRGTRAEDIAQAAGIAPRTFYRYFASKEEAVAPLYAAGAQRWADAVREAPAGLSVPEALEHAARVTLSPDAGVPGGVSAASWEWVRTLIRLAITSPALRKVWAEVCQEAEGKLAQVLAERAESEREPEERAPGEREPASADAGAAPHDGPPPDLRFAAAVASAAVRVAMETWAEGTAAATGAQGPAALAMRNLAALRDFRWDG
ncbi:TetR/AcrR family transcriptional regulator [Streptomyces sp. enrichment culture]|uniref:TetR/AcrR family transcriptional regulator n=1 Tax=Streptomyces sp. enrichment culture TaxID=1795815 RepID=UPI003F548E60